MKIITIANHKGGVAKTTTAVSLGYGLAALGYPTIIIDCDSQHNVSDFLGLRPKPSLFEVLTHRQKITDHLQRYHNTLLHVLSSETSSTGDLETLLRTPAARLDVNTVMRQALSTISNGHGKTTVIIIDTAPTPNLIQYAAIVAADWLIIPTTPEYLGETGVAALVDMARKLQREGYPLNLLGILPTIVDLRTREHAEIIEEFENHFPGLVLPAIRRRIAIAEAPGRHQTIWEYDPDNAQDYADLVAQVVERIKL